MNKFIATVMIVITMALTPCNVFAEETYSEGTLYYTVNDGSVTITGCFGKDETVEIPNQIAGYPVNTIAKGAFTGNEYVKEIILPDTITTIEEGSFNSSITVEQKVNKTTPSETDKGNDTGTDTDTNTNGDTDTDDSNSDNSSSTVIQSGSTKTITTSNTSNTSATDTANFDEADVSLDEEKIEEESVTKAEEETAASETESETKTNSPIIYVMCGIAVAVVALIVIIKKIISSDN